MNSGQCRRIFRRLGTLLIFSIAGFANAVAGTEQTIVFPVQVHSELGVSTINLMATEYRPDGAGPFPLAVINHGSSAVPESRLRMTGRFKAQSEALVTRGFAVINPTRRGYAESAGTWAEDYFSCSNPAYYEAGMETARDIAAALDYAKTRPYIDASRIILIGQSGGGFGSLALASENPPGVLGVVNFAGGRGSRKGNEVCNEDKLVATVARYASTSSIPMLWLYTANDQSFGPVLATRMAESYRKAGVPIQYVALPAFGRDGHNFFSDPKTIAVWMPMFDAFVAAHMPSTRSY